MTPPEQSCSHLAKSECNHIRPVQHKQRYSSTQGHANEPTVLLNANNSVKMSTLSKQKQEIATVRWKSIDCGK